MLKAKSSENFSKSKNLQNFDLLGALEIKGYEKLRFLLQKAHPCVNARRLSHFASKSVGRSDLQRRAGKKSQKVTRGSHRNDVSPLTQGLRYRAACDLAIRLLFSFANFLVFFSEISDFNRACFHLSIVFVKIVLLVA